MKILYFENDNNLVFETQNLSFEDGKDIADIIYKKGK